VDIEDIETFVEVANSGGVSSAARRLGLSKSIVSRRLLRLETELGAKLLSRTTRGSALTEAGTTFREHAQRVVAEMNEARDTISPVGDLRGRLRIAAPLSFGPRLFAPVLAEMAALHPQLHIHTSYSDRVVNLVGEGYDCAIRIGYLRDSSLIAKRVGPISAKLVASPDYVKANGAPETPADIVNHQALMQGTESWQFMDGNKIITVHPQGRHKADNASALAVAAVSGLGIAYLPDGVTDEYIASGLLVPVMCGYPPPTAGIYVVRPSGQNPSAKIQALTERLIACFIEHS
jgi:DNA-binding transcriptional LysR family regulator